MFFLVSIAYADLDSFMHSLNIQAKADMNGFSLKLSTQFGVPMQQVQTVLAEVRTPADAFMCFQLGKMTYKPAFNVLQVYKKNKGRGWGVIAKRLGIKPGSSEFHAIKRGHFALTGEPYVDLKKEKEKGRDNKKNRD